MLLCRSSLPFIIARVDGMGCNVGGFWVGLKVESDKKLETEFAF